MSHIELHISSIEVGPAVTGKVEAFRSVRRLRTSWCGCRGSGFLCGVRRVPLARAAGARYVTCHRSLCCRLVSIHAVKEYVQFITSLLLLVCVRERGEERQ